MVDVFWGEWEAFFLSSEAGFCSSVVNVVLYFVWLFFPTSRFHLLSFSKQDFKVEN